MIILMIIIIIIVIVLIKPRTLHKRGDPYVRRGRDIGEAYKL